jgi:hypothetical protein
MDASQHDLLLSSASFIAARREPIIQLAIKVRPRKEVCLSHFGWWVCQPSAIQPRTFCAPPPAKSIPDDDVRAPAELASAEEGFC